MRSTHYGGSIDGDIKAYLKEMHDNGAVSPSFLGYEPFKQLWDLGVVTPEITSIRLYIPARNDEHYIVADENNVRGEEVNVHAGQAGLHNTEQLLTTTEADYWEVNGLHPKAYRD